MMVLRGFKWSVVLKGIEKPIDFEGPKMLVTC